MRADTVTETITHFIGMFEMSAEEVRLREGYEAFRAERAAAAEAAALDLAGPRLKAPHPLEDYDPDTHYRDKALPLVHVPSPNAGLPPLPPDAIPPGALGDEAPPQPPPLPARAPEPSPGEAPPPALPGIVPDLPPPHSLGAVAVQLAILSDDDLLLQDGMVAEDFVDPGELAAALDALALVAEGLSLSTTVTGQGDVDWASLAHSLAEAAADPVTGGAEVVVRLGAEAAGTTVVGERAETLPSLEDYRPQALRVDAGEDEAEGAAPAEGIAPGGRGDAADAPSEVLSGLNTATNTAAVASAWLDAGVIVVGGDVVRLDAISQTNVLFDRDAVPGTGGGAEDAPSTAVNAAEIALRSSPAKTAAAGEGPAGYALVRVEGDVTQTNWIDQYTYATDFDRAEVTVSGSSLQLGLGENAILNDVSFAELGSRFDLIVVGGDLIDVSVVVQINVLLDDDVVMVQGRAAGGAMAPAISTHDNLLWNEARISTAGQNSYEAVTEPFADMLSDLASGAGRIGEALLGDGLFAGLDLLRVLYIEGDLRLVDLVRQVNVVGDSDQLALVHGGAGLSVTTGSNQLVNSARIDSVGVDSIVMARGDVYDDALLHQAELIDTGAAPTGVGLAALASEAVAFLADDFLDPAPFEGIAPTAHPGDGAMPSDVMQTMLA